MADPGHLARARFHREFGRSGVLRARIWGLELGRCFTELRSLRADVRAPVWGSRCRPWNSETFLAAQRLPRPHLQGNIFCFGPPNQKMRPSSHDSRSPDLPRCDRKRWGQGIDTTGFSVLKSTCGQGPNKRAPACARCDSFRDSGGDVARRSPCTAALGDRESAGAVELLIRSQGGGGPSRTRPDERSDAADALAVRD